MYQRNDSQLTQIALDIQANMLFQVQSLATQMNIGDGKKEIIDNMKLQSNILFVMNGDTTIAQRNAAANAAAGLSYAYADGYSDTGYWNSTYSQ